ncbi:MAG: hypothetical protein AVDCRST_MAG11-3507, partial [uncultured Gemmatimonadaceae bacterium]
AGHRQATLRRPRGGGAPARRDRRAPPPHAPRPPTPPHVSLPRTDSRQPRRHVPRGLRTCQGRGRRREDGHARLHLPARAALLRDPAGRARRRGAPRL